MSFPWIKRMDKWLPGYLCSVISRPRLVNRPIHLIFALVDHFEPPAPFSEKDIKTGSERISRWVREYPPLIESFVDSDGFHPKQTFFFPAEKYHKTYLDGLTHICSRGLGEVEIHLHHDHDTEAGLRQKLCRFRDLLHLDHGFLGTDSQKRPRYAFIHGNWALCNSHPGGKFCGVNNELSILKETGCYVDMTMPSGASPTQTKTVNAAYYASDKAGQPRSHDYGLPVRVRPGTTRQPAGKEGQRATAKEASMPAAKEALMLIQGPLALNWRWRKWGIFPRFEQADICGSNPPKPQRVNLWVHQHIHVQGRPEWVLIKIHTHGCQTRNMRVLLGDPIQELHRYLTTHYNDGRNFYLHYVTAREMYNIVRAAEAGATGNPGEFRNFEIQPPKISPF
ncbi:MAG: hypothetical protein AB1847_04185 [bacterium]